MKVTIMKKSLNNTLQILSPINQLKKQMDLSVKNSDLVQSANICYDTFTRKSVAPNLGSLGHSYDISIQKGSNKNADSLLNAFSSEYPHILNSSEVNKLISNPNYQNFCASNQQFTMLTEALVCKALPIVFSSSIINSELLMGRKLPQYLFPKIHTGQYNPDNICTTKLFSGRVFVSVMDTKRSSMNVIEFRVKKYLANNSYGDKPIYSNVHITSDVDSNYVASNYMYYYLKAQLSATKNFYSSNQSFYTQNEYDIISDAVNESFVHEIEFNKTGKISSYNKILYNASKFITEDELCNLLKINKMLP
ncbi:hypothetical protein EON71_01170 [bacterium]|nr:MAG: hypothetical protein EON71_01170 [bacterium]